MNTRELVVIEDNDKTMQAFLDGPGYLMIREGLGECQVEMSISASQAFALADFIEANRSALIEARKNGRGN